MTAAAANTIDRGARARCRPAGYQVWTNLLFLHWKLPPEPVRALIPRELTLETWDGHAWVGLVAFYMSGTRPWWFPAIPPVSNFCETNVRTYVRDAQGNPGVWFLSLDAACSPAVVIARWRWHLPYYRSTMSLARAAERVEYTSRRLWPGAAGAGCRIAACLGSAGAEDLLPLQADGTAVPGTLEHFLIERYVLFAQSKSGRLLAARVRHAPYRLRPARLEHLQQDLLQAAGVPVSGPPCHVVFSEQAVVDVFPLCAAG